MGCQNDPQDRERAKHYERLYRAPIRLAEGSSLLIARSVRLPQDPVVLSRSEEISEDREVERAEAGTAAVEVEGREHARRGVEVIVARVEVSVAEPSVKASDRQSGK